MGENMATLFQSLFDEKKKWEIASMVGKEYDFSKIREIATKLKSIAPKTCPFDVDGNDAKLMASIIEVEKKYRP